MANPEHLAILQQGVEKWNAWRRGHVGAKSELDLSDADLRKADLSRANLRRANLRGASLLKADLFKTDFSVANLSGADLSEANLRRAIFSRADLRKANLSMADLGVADLSGADLSGADFGGASLRRADLSDANFSEAICHKTDFSRACLVRSNLAKADLTGARIYGISAWDLNVTGAVQREMVITANDSETTITVDDLEVAQFIYLLLNNERVRSVIDTITSKVVLILGRFTPERKAVLDALRDELRSRNYLPVLFDFEKPANRDLTETISTLAHMARFIIADLTDAKSLPQELGRIVPFLPSVPVQPILLASKREWAMYETFPRYPWVLGTVRYESQTELLANIAKRIIEPAERQAREQIERAVRP